MAPTQSSKGGKGKAVSSRSNQSSSKAVVVHGSSNWSSHSQTQKGKTSSSWVHQDSKTQLSVSKRGSQVVFKQQFVEKKTDISSGHSRNQKGKTSSSWAHQDSKTQLGVSKRGSQVVFKQQFVEKKTDISKEKFQGFTKEVKEQISAKKTVTYKMDTAAPKRLGPKTNNKKVKIMDHNPNPNPVSQNVVTMGFSFSFSM